MSPGGLVSRWVGWLGWMTVGRDTMYHEDDGDEDEGVVVVVVPHGHVSMNAFILVNQSSTTHSLSFEGAT